MNKNYLVTGGAGFIGSNFCRRLLKGNNALVVLDSLTYAGHFENLESINTHPSFRFVEGSIGDHNLVEGIFKEHVIDTVVHFAAESHVDRSIHGSSVFIETNVLGTHNLLDVSRNYWEKLNPKEKNAFRFIQISTDEVYGSLGEEGFFSETTPYQPSSPYSASKAGGDHLALAWFHTYGMPTIVTNCSNNYGPNQFPEKLIPLMIRQILKEKPLPVYGSGLNVRDWIHVEDHCYGIELAIEKGQPGQTYCFGGNSERTNLDVVRAICRILDEIKPGSHPFEQNIEFVDDRKGHDWRYAIDDNKAKQELGFQRNYSSFEIGLKATVNWYLENQTWADQVLAKSSD